MTTPTTQEIVEQNIANIEGQINQTTPANDKAFNKVLSTTEAVLFTSLYKFGINRAKQVLAITADEDGLTDLGNEYGVPRKVAVATVLTAELPGTDPTIIPATRTFVGDSNGVRYSLDASATTAGGIATLSLTAQVAGVAGNLNNGETLSIDTQVSGAETVATVTATTTTGADQENLEDWRTRILDVIRAPGGGGNAADYRNWSQEVEGIVRAYPYGGLPGAVPSSSPPDRTVYVEADTSIDPDGIPTQALINAVRDSITTDPETGLSRQPLGMTDETLSVEPIIRTTFFIQITGLIVDPALETLVKAEIDSQVTLYFRSLRPFVGGLDPIAEKNDLITNLSVSDVVQGVLEANAASALQVLFGTSLGSFVPEYQLSQGETAKLDTTNGVTYA